MVERKREAKEVWKGVGGERGGRGGGWWPRPLKPASICRDRKLDDRNLMVAFRTSSHQDWEYIMLLLSAGWLLSDKGVVSTKRRLSLHTAGLG